MILVQQAPPGRKEIPDLRAIRDLPELLVPSDRLAPRDPKDRPGQPDLKVPLAPLVQLDLKVLLVLPESLGP